MLKIGRTPGQIFLAGILLIGLLSVGMLSSRVQASAQAAGGISQMTPNPTGTAVTVQVVTDPKLGPILTDGRGMTLYLFQIDTPGVSNCSGACAVAWPPLTLASGEQPSGSPDVTGKLGTLTRADGSVQVTINELPLYFFIQDKAPGETKGQGINAFGGLWWTVKPDGTPNTGPSSTPAPNAGAGS